MRLNERGSALLVTLWLLVALTGVAGLALAGMQTGIGTSRNRIELLRAGWAAEACLEIERNWAQRRSGPLAERLITGLDSVDLGAGLWCRVRLEDPAARVQANLATAEALHSVLGDSVLAERLLAARPLPALGALVTRHAWDSTLVAALDRVVTARGPGLINLNVADAPVLRALPGLDSAGAESWLRRRGTRPFGSLDDALATLPPGTRTRVLARYPEFVATAVVESRTFVSHVEGHVGRSPLTARVTATVVWAGDRLAVVQRELE